MTSGKFFLILLLVAACLFAIFVWPTRYRQVPERADADGVMRTTRVDRLTKRVEIETESGDWVELSPPPPRYDLRNSPVGHSIGKAEQAEKDIKKMNEVVNEATKHDSPVK